MLWCGLMASIHGSLLDLIQGLTQNLLHSLLLAWHEYTHYIIGSQCLKLHVDDLSESVRMHHRDGQGWHVKLFS